MPISTEIRTVTNPRVAELIQTNVLLLQQALKIIAELDDQVYSTAPPGFGPYRVGAHVRHILDFYRCFIIGVQSRQVDYAARGRDRDLEISRAAASIALGNVIDSLERSPFFSEDGRILVVPENCACGIPCPEDLMSSSVSRELAALSAHTIHHFALIALTLRLHGVGVHPEFGMAPSTLRFLASQTQQ